MIWKKICVIFLVFFCFGCSSKESEYVPLEKSDSSKENFKEIDSISVKNLDSNKEKSKKFDSVSFVKKFYKLYNPYGLPNSEEDRLNDFLSKSGNEYLTQNLKSLILEDIKCRQEGYVCNLEVDPFYNSQDKIELLSVTKERDGEFNVSFNNKIEVKVILDCMEKACLISNLIYSDGSNLEEILKQTD